MIVSSIIVEIGEGCVIRALRYTLLLFDADSTLFDFPKAEREAFEKTMHAFGLPSDDATYVCYSAINDGYWHALGRKEITKPELVVRRFADLLHALSVPGNPRKINAYYLKQLGEGHYLLPGALDVCKTLSAHCRLVIATNGVDATQQKRLARSGLAPYIETLISSDKAGADKPDPRFFEYLFSQIPPAEKSETLMIGDLLGTDIKGGIDFGIHTCWFNPTAWPPPEGWPITYIIHRLEDLLDIVLLQHATVNDV